MKIKSVEIENFMGLIGVHMFPNVDLLGLCHIAGENHDDPQNDSNGSCKTTILEAMTWCNFGEGLPRKQGNTEKGVGADEVLNDTLKKQCKVSMVFEDDHVYKIARWRKYKHDKTTTSGASLEIDGKDQTALDPSETNDLICKALGITWEIWCRSVIYGQESGFNFCEATPKSRSDILTTVMGTEIIDDWQENQRNEKKARLLETASLEGRISELRSRIESEKANNPQPKIDGWEQQRTQRIVDKTTLLTEVKQRGIALKANLAKWVDPQSQITQLQNTYFETIDATAQSQAHSDIISQIKGIEGQISVLVQQDQEIAAAQVQKVCPMCKRPFDITHKPHLVDHSAQIASLQAQIVPLRTTETNCKSALEATTATRLQQDQQKQQIHRQIQELEQQKQSYQALSQQIEYARNEWTMTQSAITQIQAEINPMIGLKKEWEDRIEALIYQDQEIDQKLGTETKFLDECKWWDRELPRFKTWLFDSIVDQLAAEANRWLKIMSGGVLWVEITTQVKRGKTLKDELTVTVSRWNPDGSIISRPYRLWSGGEKRRISLAIDLGLSHLMSTRASKPYRFLALDEIDRHLDDAGREGLRKVLLELRKERDTCLVITHDPFFKASFDAQITVKKQGGKVEIGVDNDDCGKDKSESGLKTEDKEAA